MAITSHVGHAIWHERLTSVTWLCSACLFVTSCAAILAPGIAVAQQESRTGWFHVIWADPPEGQGAHFRTYWLITDDGDAIPISVKEELILRLGGPERLERQRVTVHGDWVAQAGPVAETAMPSLPLTLRSMEIVSVIPHVDAFANPDPIGAKPFLTILCALPAEADWGFVPLPNPSLWETVMGSSYPGMHHYWREVSYGSVDLTGSRVVGWYQLQQPMVYYFQDGNSSQPNLGRIFQDCTAAAQADISFSEFAGINIQLNGRRGLAYGGSYTATLDGSTRPYHATWLVSIGAGSATYVHEMGHSFGFAHHTPGSSRWHPLAAGFRWDTSIQWPGSSSPRNSIATHPIAPDKESAGWIPSARTFIAAAGSSQSMILERLANPTATSSYLLARLASHGTSGTVYTAEARQDVGDYDAALPGNAVIIHAVDPQCYSLFVFRDDCVILVSHGGDGDPVTQTMWRPGEEFQDSLRGVSIRVDSATTNGFGVTLTRGWLLEITISGQGRVSSPLAGIDCGTACRSVLGMRGTAVSLTATPAAGWLFAGWDGACFGTDDCILTMNANRSVSALFAQPLSILSDSVRQPATMGAPYADTLKASGGTGAWIWSPVAGAVPRGLAFDTVTGVLAGIPEEAGTFHYAVTVISGPLSVTGSFAITVGKPVLQASAVLDHLLGSGSLTADHIRFLDLLGNRNGRLDVGDVRAWLVENQQLSSNEINALRALVGTGSEKVEQLETTPPAVTKEEP
jgi:M6 family metalloprotease-like protein